MSRIQSLFSLEGKVALVTGAGTGIGAHVAHTLADAGARVICAARRVEKIEAVVASIRAAGGEALALPLDVGDTRSVGTVFEQAGERWGLVDVLINNAGQLEFARFPNIDDDDWNRLINVNLSGAMRMAREFSKRLLAAKKPGTIVNVASITGMQVLLNSACYSSAKAGLIHLTRQIAADLLGSGIRCNAIAPGYFRTGIVGDYYETEHGRAVAQRLPAGRPGEVDELDGVLLLLASNASSYMNGAVVPVDYGHATLLP